MLATFPAASWAPYQPRRTLAEWLDAGTFTVISATSRAFRLNVAHDDFSSCVLTDSEALLNHCLEHQNELIRFSDAHRACSDAWAIVTLYYFGFFSAQLFLRLVGSPVLFLDKAFVKKLMEMAPLGSTSPHAGAYWVSSITPVSASHSEIVVEKSQHTTIHDLTWSRSFELIRGLVKQYRGTGKAEEVTLFDALADDLPQFRSRGGQWPASVRAAANYRPGFAYQAVDNAIVGNVSAAVGSWRTLTSAEFPGHVDNTRLRAKDSLAVFGEAVCHLGSVSAGLFLVSAGLLEELSQRRKRDSRWNRARLRFETRVGGGRVTWPLFDMGA